MNWPLFDTGVAFGVAAIGASLIVRFNLWIYRKVGLHNLADYWEPRLTWWIPTVRIACAVAALVFMAAGLIVA